jgi:phosphohistidine phosphatase
MSTSKKAAPKKTSRKATPKKPPAEERFIVVLRHGIAEDPSPEKKDEDRGLTSEGHARMKEIARGLEHALPKVQVIYTSPLLRAVQTALWVSKGYKSRVNINTTDVLAPSASTKQFVALVQSIEEKRVIFVGHEPNLTANMSALTGVDAAKLELKKGGCYGVRIAEDGSATLDWLLSPRVLRRMGE